MGKRWHSFRKLCASVPSYRRVPRTCANSLGISLPDYIPDTLAYLLRVRLIFHVRKSIGAAFDSARKFLSCTPQETVRSVSAALPKSRARARSHTHTHTPKEQNERNAGRFIGSERRWCVSIAFSTVYLLSLFGTHVSFVQILKIHVF